MSLEQFVGDLKQLVEEAKTAFGGAASGDDLDAARIEFLGAKKGRLKTIQKSLGSIDKADKPTAGQQLNATKSAITEAFDAAKDRLGAGTGGEVADPTFDPTLPGTGFRMGNLHPITQTINELKDIMGRLGFTHAEGPEVEDDYHNFKALNIPSSHPARDPLDNFYLRAAQNQADSIGEDLNEENPLLLRSQTSTVQTRYKIVFWICNGSPSVHVIRTVKSVFFSAQATPSTLRMKPLTPMQCRPVYLVLPLHTANVVGGKLPVF